ncbi:MAG: Nif3-like dinuclear metal center hexameric protein [Bacteroides sp.]|nr:MAG: Nif3-like dinuclear metal center hexameric protein [Bacteroides sp.]
MYDSLNIKLEIILSKYFSYKIFNLIDNLIKDYDILYEIYPLLNNQYHIGMGMIGDLKFNLDVISFLKLIKYKMNIKCLRHTKFLKTNISSVALCGGRGISLIDKAIDLQADVFITSDIKYHEFFNANNQIMLVDIGHYESEQYIVQFLTQSINKKFNNNLAINSQINTNPIKYF